MKYTAKFRKLPRRSSSCTTRKTPRGVRPAALLEPRPQGPVQRHTAQHIVDILPYVQILDVPVPQMGAQVVEALQKIDTPSVEHVIAAPKISLDTIPQRSPVVVRRRQNHVLHSSAAAACGANR